MAEAPPTETADKPPEPVAPEKRPPIYKVGPIPTGVNESIEVCVWAREVQYEDRMVTLYSVTLQASYRDGNEWKRASSLKYQQVPVAIFAMQRAFDHISALKDRSNGHF